VRAPDVVKVLSAPAGRRRPARTTSRLPGAVHDCRNRVHRPHRLRGWSGFRDSTV